MDADSGVGEGLPALAGASPDFGRRLAELRAARGWSLSVLAERTQISASHLGNLERSERRPSRQLAEICDRVLGGGGELIALVPALVKQLAPDAEALVVGYTAVLESLRDLGRSTGPRFVLDPVVAASRVLRDGAAGIDGADGRAVWLLAARFAEYAGWMAQESGNDVAAIRWSQTAVQWAGCGGDPTMAAYALVRRALIAQHRGDAKGAIGFARRAAAHPAVSATGSGGGHRPDAAAAARIRAFAARREAQAHALNGDERSCRRALEASQALILRHPDPAPGGSGWGPRATPETFGLVEASCLVALGHFGRAVRLFEAEFARLPVADNAYQRFVVRYAAALAGTGEAGRAREVLAGLRPAADRLDSATVRNELRSVRC
jgi:transcriptional regulator with XRE-family HTH domain